LAVIEFAMTPDVDASPYEAVAEQPAPARGPFAALEAMAFGAVVCDRRALRVYANPAAEALARGRLGLSFSKDKIGAMLPAQTQQLARLIQRAAGGGAAGSLLLTDRDGTALLIALVTPLPQVDGGRALVAIRQVGGRPAFTQAGLRELFRLSPAQAALAMGLYEGKSFEDIATERGVKISTLRTHFAEVLARTGSKSLRDLVRRLGTIPPLL
jgi:DNA-binding NarL/FixJ family response regulator